MAIVSGQSAIAAVYQEGVDYVKITGIPEATKPVVREFFSYNCGHCYKQDAFFKKVANLLGDEIQFERTPVGAGRNSWILSQEAYYLAQKFSVTKQVHGNIFTRIHEKEGAFTRPDQLKDFFVKQGLNEQDVEAAMNSTDAKLALMNYDTQAQLAGIRGVPSIVVDGKYLVKNPGKTPEDLVRLVKYLNVLEE
ncbi:thiol:disulfide interchange protein DsbA/DsbL [Shewanella sairae]